MCCAIIARENIDIKFSVHECFSGKTFIKYIHNQKILHVSRSHNQNDTITIVKTTSQFKTCSDKRKEQMQLKNCLFVYRFPIQKDTSSWEDNVPN